MNNYYLTETDRLNDYIRQNAPLTLKELAQRDITRFFASPKYIDMLTGERYYRGEHDILRRTRTAIGEGGKTVELDNLPNNRVVNNVYKRLVDQKANYLLGKPLTVKCDTNKAKIRNIFNRQFFRTLKGLGEDALNCGIGWLYIYFDGYDRVCFKCIRPFELIPAWSDREHTALDYAVRVYRAVEYIGKSERVSSFAEVYTRRGVRRYRLDGTRLKELSPLELYGHSFDSVPLVPFRYNSKELPLIKNIKTLQDGLNSLMSDFQNCMEEDVRNTILVIKNYDGEDLGQFRKNLSAYGAVKVKTVDGSQGGVETLNIEVNADNYKAIIEIFKKAIIENGRGYDSKDDRLFSNPSQMNIMSMFNDIDIDANGMETEFSAALEQVLHLAGINASGVDFIFNRSMILNDSETIDNIVKSKGILDDDILKAKHPWS